MKMRLGGTFKMGSSSGRSLTQVQPLVQPVLNTLSIRFCIGPSPDRAKTGKLFVDVSIQRSMCAVQDHLGSGKLVLAQRLQISG